MRLTGASSYHRLQKKIPEGDYMQTEPLHVSSRFHTAVTSAVMKLERQAALDEHRMKDLVDADHRRRHKLLVDTQLQKAFKLREMLRQMQVRGEAYPVFEIQPPR
jgi:hypothetical protein